MAISAQAGGGALISADDNLWPDGSIHSGSRGRGAGGLTGFDGGASSGGNSLSEAGTGALDRATDSTSAPSGKNGASHNIARVVHHPTSNSSNAAIGFPLR